MISIKVPPLGESIVEATVARWVKREGDTVAQGDTIVELETDKITVEVPALKAGTLVKRLHQEGDVVKVDDELGQIDETATTPAAAAPRAAATVAAATASPSAPTATQAPAPPSPPSATRASPAARRVAEDAGVDLGSVAGTGRGGMVTKSDVIEAHGDGVAAQRSAAPSAPADPAAPPGPSPAPRPTQASAAQGRETRERMTTRRKRIAENLVQAQHATAHLTTFNEIDMSAVMGVRERLKERVEKQHGVKLTFMPFFARATTMALNAYPVVNAQIDGDTIIYKHYVNLGIAVASDQGLVVPVIKDADRLGMIEFSRQLSGVAARARDGKLTMDDLTGGTFTITNGGVFGSLVSTPILNYPQVGILGLHKIQDRPVAIDGQVVIRPMMYIALSYDHRLVDGQQAVLFLVRVKELMEDPAAMLVD
ncbi:MAG TPA: 2-oxoglutarate dehydrogenase complex dihydrolipoyllysine-residue succinyltransferase [Gemmatimonadaceae bacterium]|nr:2-oxoglutarate dehydrogenase complex dihydrolipoyllysine-residue succinyltransferase [Gemmatimonadaceae bacterium]